MGNKRNTNTDKQRNNSGKFTIKPSKKRSTEHLKPYKFKPGQSGNPKGRPKSILSKRERLELLSEMAKMNKHKANPVEAIREQNRMEGVYQEAQTGYIDNRQVNIIVSSDKAKELTENVGRRLLREAEVKHIAQNIEGNEDGQFQ